MSFRIFTIAAIPSSETFSDSFMKSLLLITTLLIMPGLFARAASAEQEKAFVAKYKTALEANDSATLESVLYTTGADPMIVGFYKMMQSGGAGDKVSKIELVELTPDDVKKATAPQDSPNGGKVCLNLKPTEKLVIVIEKKDETAAQPIRPRILSLRKTANLSFRCQDPVNSAIN